MFYDIYVQLCEERGITPTKASSEIGFSKGSVSYWKKRYTEGVDAKPDSYTAMKIADYFGVSVDYLLNGDTGKIETPAPKDERDREFITLVEQLTDEEKKLIAAQIKGILSSRE